MTRVVRNIAFGIALAMRGALFVFLTSTAFPRSPPVAWVTEGSRADPQDVYNPVTEREPLPDGFRQLLPRDGIQPIYDPQFTSADDVEWPDATQVIGVVSGDEAKAYPVSFLNRHEMVNDFIAGDPILFTW